MRCKCRRPQFQGLRKRVEEKKPKVSDKTFKKKRKTELEQLDIGSTREANKKEDNGRHPHGS